MNYLLQLPDEASGERFRGMWHQSLALECILPVLVVKTFTCPYWLSYAPFFLSFQLGNSLEQSLFLTEHIYGT